MTAWDNPDMSRRCRPLGIGFALALALSLPAPASADGISAKAYKSALRDVETAVRESDRPAFLVAVKSALRRNDRTAVRAVLDAYDRFLRRAGEDLSPRQFYAFHGRAAKTLAAVDAPRAVLEMETLAAKHRSWRSRLLLLDAASFHRELDILETALKALRDDEPVVVRRSLDYLSRAKKRSVVEAIIDRYLELESGKGTRADDADRLAFSFQAALVRLIRVELTHPQDYKNYVSARESDQELFEPRDPNKGGKTALTLFGASVTGKNIVFILDTSGSMLTTDTLPDGVAPRRPGSRTVVRGGKRSGKREPTGPPPDRQRIVRAKKELARVIRALPEDVSFNIVAYSSGVDSWKESLTPARSKAKKDAIRFVDGLKPEGVTVTDLALEVAFADLSVDTVYLITDGAPTHVGSSGRDLPTDAPQLMGEIHRSMREMNFLRGIRIFTLGFHGAEEDFLRKLSRDHYGRYVRIE